MKTLVLGVGNPILSDDAVGLRVAQELRKRINDPQIDIAETSAAGFSFLDFIIGYDTLIIIDAVQTEKGQAGQIYRLSADELSLAKNFYSPHQVNLVTALELGKLLDLAVPQEITIFAVEAQDVNSFSEKCTLEVEQAIPRVVEMVLQELHTTHIPKS